MDLQNKLNFARETYHSTDQDRNPDETNYVEDKNDIGYVFDTPDHGNND